MLRRQRCGHRRSGNRKGQDMAERRYTFAEIDHIRAFIRRSVPYPQSISYSCDVGVGGLIMTAESRAELEQWERLCEDRLRTALIGGVDPPE